MKKYYRDDCDDNARMKLVESLFIHFELDEIVDSVVDHKGTLSVYWKHLPDTDCVSKVNSIWELFNEFTVEHCVRQYKQINF